MFSELLEHLVKKKICLFHLICRPPTFGLISEDTKPNQFQKTEENVPVAILTSTYNQKRAAWPYSNPKIKEVKCQIFDIKEREQSQWKLCSGILLIHMDLDSFTYKERHYCDQEMRF